jgi:7-carboxy-7-deazaguanine synthase
MELDEIVETVERFGLKEVCITGGEPLLQDIMPLLQRFLADGHHVLLETNGSLNISDHLIDGVMISMDWKVPSSGESDKMLLDNLVHLRESDQIKFVVENADDLAYVAKFLKDVDIRAPAVVQPVGGLNLEWLVDAVLTNGIDVRVMPQLHKFIWGEERGV